MQHKQLGQLRSLQPFISIILTVTCDSSVVLELLDTVAWDNFHWIDSIKKNKKIGRTYQFFLSNNPTSSSAARWRWHTCEATNTLVTNNTERYEQNKQTKDKRTVWKCWRVRVHFCSCLVLAIRHSRPYVNFFYSSSILCSSTFVLDSIYCTQSGNTSEENPQHNNVGT